MVVDGNLQQIWSYIVQRWGGVVSHWLFPAVVGYITLVTLGIYFTLKDIGPWPWRSARINQNCLPDAQQMFRVASIQCVLYAVGITTFWLAIPHHVELPPTVPTLYEFLRDVSTSLVIGDFLYFLQHIIHHKIPFLWRKVHYVHHRYKRDVFCWAVGWAHPFEMILGLLAIFVYPCVISPIHPLSLWVYESIFFGLLMEEHSNHDVWWSPGHWVPAVFGGAVPHGVHHAKIKANYGFLFAIWDQILGTYIPPSNE